ncbi:hypothetical protein LJR232_002609 [Aquipseudomonas alcaligenes]
MISVFAAFNQTAFNVTGLLLQVVPATENLTPEIVALVRLVAVQVHGSPDAVTDAHHPLPVTLTELIVAVLLLLVTPMNSTLHVTAGSSPAFMTRTPLALNARLVGVMVNASALNEIADSTKNISALIFMFMILPCL